MSKKRSRRRFTDEFKAETVKLVKQSDQTMSAIAMELGSLVDFRNCQTSKASPAEPGDSHWARRGIESDAT